MRPPFSFASGRGLWFLVALTGSRWGLVAAPEALYGGLLLDWMVLPFRRYADFAGRSCRREYWMFQLLNVAVIAVALALTIATAPAPDAYGRPQGPGALGWVMVTLGSVFVLAAFVPNLAVEVRRYHDLGKPGYYWFWRLFPGIGGLIVLYFMVQRGADGPNEFGEDPLEPAPVTVFG